MNATREDWLKDRQSLIGASDTPSILGRGYRTAAQVWAEKCGFAEADNEANADVKLRIGTIIQPALVQVARAVFNLPAIAEHENVVRRSADVPYIGASLDAVAGQDGNGRDVPLELKNVDAINGRAWVDAPPLEFQIQSLQQQFVTGSQFGYVMGLIGGNRPVLHRVERNEVFLSALLRKLEWFWNLVTTRTPPPYQDPYDQARVLATLYPKSAGTAIALDEVAERIVQRRDAASIIQTEAEIKVAECDNELKAMLGANTYAALPGGRWVSWKEIPGSTYEVTRKPYRRLMFHDKRPKDAPALEVEAVEPLAVECDRDAAETRPDFVERSLQCQEALLNLGGIVRHESDSGSAYLVLPGGLHVRVSDHEPNEKTNSWIERHGVVEIRVDQDDWEQCLSSVVGVLSK